MKKSLVIIGLLFAVVLTVLFYFGKLSLKYLTNSQETLQITTNNTQQPKTSEQKTAAKPTKVVFMRLGEIWVKDLLRNDEKKISREKSVSNPSFSPTGKFVLYSSINRAGDGFPTSDLFFSSADGSKYFLFPYSTNYHAGKFLWSEDDKYLGLVFFPYGKFKSQLVAIFDTVNQKLHSVDEIDKVFSESVYSKDIYVTKKGACEETISSLEMKNFCLQYMAHLLEPRVDEFSIEKYEKEEKMRDRIFSQYKRKYYENKPFVDVLDNGLVIAQFHKGKPHNKVADMEAHITGYDPGITETYTLLLSSDLSELITTVDSAVDTDFFFEK